MHAIRFDRIWSIAALLFLVGFTFVIAPAAAQEPPPPMKILENVWVSLPPDWAPIASLFAGAGEIVTPAKQGSAAGKLGWLQATDEDRLDERDALRRLAEIAEETPGPVSYLEIGGWPALERLEQAPLARKGQAGQPFGDIPLAWRVTTAIAVGDRVVRFETVFAPDVPSSLVADATAIGRSARFDRRGDVVDKQLEELRSLPRKFPPRLTATAPDERPDLDFDVKPAAGAAVATGVPLGELEIAASNDGLNVVVAGNFGHAFSRDGGAKFNTGGGPNTPFQQLGDPSVAFGVGGTFYWGYVGQPNGTPAALNVTGFSVAVATSTDNGQTFNFFSHATLCPQAPPGQMCFPDQPHIAADRVNAAPGGDQVYAVWRNFNPWSWCPVSAPGAQPSSVRPTARPPGRRR